MNSFNQFDISVVIPQKNSIKTLGRLLESIPNSDRVEIIIVDNSQTPITKNDIGIKRDYELYWASPERFAGGARNIGVQHSHGKWLVFADADDYFTDNAFETFFSYVNDDADVIYFGMTGIYDDTKEYSARGEYYTKRVRDYLSGQIDEYEIRVGFGTPCSKMVRREFAIYHDLRFDEVVACNDSYFALLAGFYARKIKAVDAIVYVATVSRGTITKRKDFEASYARYLVTLRINRFLKKNGLSKYQEPIMAKFRDCVVSKPSKIFLIFGKALVYHQNLLIGFNLKNWLRTLLKRKDSRESKYEVR